MKFPQNIVLDYNILHNAHSNRYWALSYVMGENFFFFNCNNFFINNFFFKNKNFIKNSKHIFSKKKSIFFSSNKDLKNVKNLNSVKLSFYKKIFINRFKVKNKVLFPKNNPKTVYNFFLSKNLFNESLLFRMLTNFSYCESKNKINFFFSKNLFDIYFLRKERIYTKLKYSRTPQYDIVSGGAAALFAGFLGFLICEKFGFELLDSGDFYFLFMYIVFLVFSLRFFIKLIDIDLISWNFLSLKWFFTFYLIIFKKFFNFNFFKKKI